MKVQLLSTDPEVVLFGDFLSQEEAQGLIRLAEGHFVESKITCDKRGGCVSSYRTSATAYLPITELTTRIAERGMKLARLPYAESLQIVRYFPGQEFKPHLDAFDPGSVDGQRELASYGGRQRDATFLIYLNDGMEGGSTRFSRLDLEVRPEPGAALYWRNVGLNGKVDPRTLHQGMPVTSGVKYAVNLWIRGSKSLAGYPCPPRENRIAALRNFVTVSVPVKLGKPGLGEAKPMPVVASVKVERQAYVGTGPTLLKMAAFIREGSANPAMKQFAEMVVKQAGVPSSEHLTHLKAAQILLAYVKKNVRYRSDPNNVELVQSAEITLCVPGASICIPVGDCDDQVVALGSLMGAYGIPVKIMKQSFGDDIEEEHVLVIFETDDHRWLAADPTAPADVGVGFRASASKEEIIDPLDPTGSGTQASEFVSVGRRSFELTISKEIEVTFAPRQVLKKIGSGWLPTIIYPSTVRDAQAQLLTSAQGVDTEVQACTGLDQATGQAWVLFLQGLTAFCNEDPGIWGLGSRMDRVESYQTELYAWQQSLHQLCTNVTPTTPEPEAPPINGGPWLPVAHLGLYAVIGVAGAYAVGQLVKGGAEVLETTKILRRGGTKTAAERRRRKRAA